MDPLSALSVATAVVQFVDFGAKLISKSKELYRSTDGVLAEHTEQAAVATRLKELARQLVSAIPTSTAGRISPAEQGLFEVSRECQMMADEFLEALEGLKVVDRHRKWKSFRQALKSVWKSAGIEKRLATLDRLRQLTIIHLLVVLKEGHMKSLLGITGQMHSLEDTILNALIEQKHAFDEQLVELRKSLAQLARNSTTSEPTTEVELTQARNTLLDHWRKDNTEALCQVLKTIQRDDDDKKKKSFRRMVLDSLYFPNMHDRQNMVYGKDAATLDWVFEPPSHMRHQWSDFPDWLAGNNGLYWVSGKAGSGKSTLMKWLFQEDRTRAALETWAKPQRLLLASHFFWNAGSKHQRSLSGLLRSLLYELLSQCADQIWHVSPSRWRCHDLQLSHFPSWSDEELLYALKLFFRHTAGRARICLFIDGLDEFVGDETSLLQVLKLLNEESQQLHLKVCVSSRPWEMFKDTFASHPSLRLEDLTRSDIEGYINRTLLSNDQFRIMQNTNRAICTRLVDEILDKARGVWLWVVLVVRSLLRGLRNHDTLPDLQARLRQIPEELEDYFLQMFSSIESVYRVKSLKLLKIALNDSHGLSLMTSSFLDEENTEFPYQTPLEPISDEELEKRLIRTEKRVNILCFDLLETITWDHERHRFYQQSIEFFHRTARDFLLEQNTQSLVAMESVNAFDVNLFMCKALLAQIKMASNPTRLLLADFMHYAAFLEDALSSDLPPLLDHLDSVLKIQGTRKWIPDDITFNSPVKEWSYDVQSPKPLLPLAIQYGLTRYVLSNLSINPSLIFLPGARPILDVALRRRIYSPTMGPSQQIDPPMGGPPDIPDLETVTLILRNGSDPNEMLGNSTVWERFLQYLSTFSEDFQRLDEDEILPWIQTAELLIRSGASRILASERYIPRQPSSRITVRTAFREVTARSSLAAAFGESEAERLDLLSMWLNVTGRNLLIKTVRTVQHALRFIT